MKKHVLVAGYIQKKEFENRRRKLKNTEYLVENYFKKTDSISYISDMVRKLRVKD